jgi:hypothetical protein
MLPTIEFMTTYANENHGSSITEDGLSQWNDLSRLLHDQDITGEALVDSALTWLLDDRGNQVAST